VLDPAAPPLLVQVAADPAGGPLLSAARAPAKAACLCVRRAGEAVTHAGWYYQQPGYVAFPAKASKHHH
jgi:hypothetical protein